VDPVFRPNTTAIPNAVRFPAAMKRKMRGDVVVSTTRYLMRQKAMSNAPNDLAEDFPDKADRIRELKTSNNRFARLYDEYNELNRTIHRIETRVEPTTEDVEEDLKRRRVRIKDEILVILTGETA
jgi:uncharacterized protein